jgi:hypothetical protein
LAAVCLLLLAAVCVWLLSERASLVSENAILIAAAEAHHAREKQAAELQQRADANETARARQEHLELLRLRAEVSQLRRQMSDARLATAKNRTAESNTPPSGSDDTAPTLNHYVSRLQVSVPWQQTLVTGGWQLPSGKHGLFFMQPRRVNPAGVEDYDSAVPGQITLQTWIAEVPEDVLSRSVLASLKTYTATDARHTVLSTEDARGIINLLQQTAGVDVLSAPKITTLDGRPARIALGQGEASSGPQPGPALDFTPVALPDGAGVELNLSANLWLPKP